LCGIEDIETMPRSFDAFCEVVARAEAGGAALVGGGVEEEEEDDD
jgi:hypothetical protein